MNYKILYYLMPVIVLVSLTVFPARAVSIVALLAATVVWWTFVVWYAIRSKWHKNPYGRNTMGTSFGMAALLAVFSVAVLFPGFTGHEIVWALAFVNLTILGVQHTYLMERTQRSADRDEN